MRVELIRIGNSRGIRLPKPLIEQCGFGNAVELYIEEDRLIIAPDRCPRRGWKDAFALAGPRNRDELLLEGMPPSNFDAQEWTW